MYVLQNVEINIFKRIAYPTAKSPQKSEKFPTYLIFRNKSVDNSQNIYLF